MHVFKNKYWRKAYGDKENQIELDKLYGYFVVYDESGLEVAHPSLEEQNVWDVEDKSGSGFKLV